MTTLALDGGGKWLGTAVIGWLLLVSSVHAQDAASLKARHATLREQLANNPFRRPIHLESTERKHELKGEVYAQLDKPFALLALPLQGTDHWCDILILHLNVKSCRPSTSTSSSALSMHIGRKYDQPLADTYAFEFLYKVLAVQPDYLQVELSAPLGPMGTSDYHVVLEVVQLDANRSFLHMSYAYKYGSIASVAMGSYLATSGRNKVGFSVVKTNAAGEPVYIRGVRGIVERNTMRYYLAIEAYVDALTAPKSQQLEKRLNDWYSAGEQYPMQLHEMERADYIAMKHKEVQRQLALTKKT
jgi:hypothetical protein